MTQFRQVERDPAYVAIMSFVLFVLAVSFGGSFIDNTFLYNGSKDLFAQAIVLLILFGISVYSSFSYRWTTTAYQAFIVTAGCSAGVFIMQGQGWGIQHGLICAKTIAILTGFTTGSGILVGQAAKSALAGTENHNQNPPDV